MKVGSANLNQRIGNTASRRRFESWLHYRDLDVVLAQEPFNSKAEERPVLTGYELISTSPLLSAWAKAPQASRFQVRQHGDRWQELSVGGLNLHNLYLSPHSSKERRDLLDQIASHITDNTPSIVLGDFNLAPRPEDGRFGQQESGFTSPAERRAFARLLSAATLVDATCSSGDAEPEFTFERMQQGKQIRFRCDLALVSAALIPSTSIEYDHTVRIGASAFTDHSAILVSLPIIDGNNQTVNNAQGSRRPSIRGTAMARRISAADSHKTAIRRRDPSQIARALSQQGILEKLDVHSVLDVGCAYGEDVRFYRSLGFDAEGFDPEPRFGFDGTPDRQFDLVTLVFVVNVLPSPEERLDAAIGASRFVRPGGFLLIAARSESAVRTEARRGNWPSHNDGWISSAAKGTFQKGIAQPELGWLLGAAGLAIVDCPLRLSSDVSWIVGAKRAAR